MTLEKVYTLLKDHVPDAALDYCIALWKTSPFELKITKSRLSKVGDFTSRGTRRHPRITINVDLNPYLFLHTYVHEVAHLHVYLKYGGKVEPHGEKWRTVFTDLMIPLLWETIFPDEILHELRRHMINPKASSFADADLIQAFRKFDTRRNVDPLLRDIPEGSIFQFHGRYFKKGKLKRTRVLCLELKSKRNYLVPAEALVSNVQLSLL